MLAVPARSGLVPKQTPIVVMASIKAASWSAALIKPSPLKVMPAKMRALSAQSSTLISVAPDRLGALLATGLTAMIAVQAFVNISVVLGLLPTKGIPLPFVSNGGSSMLANMIAMGIILNITQHATAVDPGGRVTRAAHTARLDQPAGAEG